MSKLNKFLTGALLFALCTSVAFATPLGHNLGTWITGGASDQIQLTVEGAAGDVITFVANNTTSAGDVTIRTLDLNLHRL